MMVTPFDTPFDTAPAAFPTPWAARAFALVNAAAQAGWCTLRDFQQALIVSIRTHEAQGGCIGDEAAYYDCWIIALTTLLRERGVSPDRLEALEAAIRDRQAAAAHAHHGPGHAEVPQPLHVEAAR